MTEPGLATVRAARARLHRWVCHGQHWSPDCQHPGGRHERETWPLPRVRELLADDTGDRLHTLVCPLVLDRTKTCPRPDDHAKVLYAALTGWRQQIQKLAIENMSYRDGEPVTDALD